ncbi:MAG: DUF3858 domain-containing protein [Candidatus Zixiibacteriota bacterium]
MRCGWHLIATAVAASLLLLPEAATAQRRRDTTTFQWEAVTEADWNVGKDTAWAGAHAVMIFEKISVDERKLAEDRVYRSLYRRIRILDMSGRSQAEVEAPMEDAEQRVTRVIARTVLPSGEEIAMTDKDIHRETVLKVKGAKWKQTRFSIPGVTDDCIIEYRIVYQAERSAGGWLIQKDIPLVQGEYRWYYCDFAKQRSTYYFDLPFIWVPLREPEYVWTNVKPSAPKRFPAPGIEDSTEMLFTVKNVPAREDEQMSLPEDSRVARLFCSYGTGSLPIEFWSTMSSSMSDWMKDNFCGKTARMKAVLAAALPDGDSEQKMATAYAWVQDSIVNTSFVDLQEAMEERGVNRRIRERTNETADDVIKRKYGWSGVIDALYCSMLRELGIDARIGFVVDRDDDMFVRDFKWWQFDRSLVVVFDSAKSTRFFAPGYPHMPYGMVPWFNEGVQMLLEGTQGEFLTVTPAGPSATSQTYVYDYVLVPGEETVGKVQARLTGHAAGTIRATLFDADSSEYKELLDTAVANLLPSGVRDSLTCTGVERAADPITVHCALTFPSNEEQAGRLFLKPLDYFVSRDNPFVAATRKTPIAFPFAYQRNEAAQFTLPAGWSIEALPSDTMFSNRVGKCGVQFLQLGDKLSVQRNFTLNAPMWKKEDYRDVRALFLARQEMSDRTVVLTRAGGAATN